MRVAIFERRHEMDALAARHFRPALNACLIEEITQPQGCLDHLIPFDALSRINVEHDAIGALNIIDSRIPWVERNDIHVDKPKQPVQVFPVSSRRRPAVALGDLDVVSPVPSP